MSIEDEIQNLEMELRAAKLADKISHDTKLKKSFCNEFTKLKDKGFDSTTAISLALNCLSVDPISTALVAFISMITNMKVAAWCKQILS